VLVRLLHAGGPKLAWFARTTPIAKMWDVVGVVVRQGARVLVWPSGGEVAVGAMLGEVVDGNHVTLELRLPGLGGGVEDDEELLDASFRGNVGKVEEALGRGANVNCQHFMGTRPLHRAAMNGHVEVVQFLLAAGADPNARVTEDVRRRPSPLRFPP